MILTLKILQSSKTERQLRIYYKILFLLTIRSAGIPFFISSSIKRLTNINQRIKLKVSLKKISYAVVMLFRYLLDLLSHFDQNHKHQTLLKISIEINTKVLKLLTTRHRLSIVLWYFHNCTNKYIKNNILMNDVQYLGFTLLEK